MLASSRSPPGTQAGSMPIGSMTTISNFVFNTAVGKGTVNMRVIITLTEEDETKNPYGVGTIEGILIAEVTSVNPDLSATYGQIPGDATGFIVATHGTGAFEDAKLKADVDLRFATLTLPGITLCFEFIFFGTHIDYPDNEGLLIYHNPSPP